MMHCKLALLLLSAFLVAGSVKSEPNQDLLQANDGLTEANQQVAKLADDNDDEFAGELDGSDESTSDEDEDSDESSSDEGGDNESDENVLRIRGRKQGSSTIRKGLNKLVGKRLSKRLKNVKKARHCMFKPIVETAKIGNTLAVALFNLWKNYRGNNLPVLKTPTELIDVIVADRLDYRALVKLAANAAKHAIKAGVNLFKVVIRFLRCVRKVKGKRPLFSKLKAYREKKRQN